MIRQGLGRGHGKGFFNILPIDSRVHSMSAKGLSQPQTIQYLNLNRYQGRWHEIGSFPAWFQKGCAKAIADYSKSGSEVKVTNSCIRDGKREYRYATAIPTDKTNAKLKVNFGFVSGDYWVIHTDYKTAIVGTPDRKYLWILARKPEIPKSTLNKLIGIAKRQGYDTTKLKVEK